MPQSSASTGVRADRRRGWATIAGASGSLVVLCTLAFVVTAGACWSAGSGLLAALLGLDGQCGPTLAAFGGLAADRVWLDGQGWRMASAGLLHASLPHLLLNVFSLRVIGPPCEARLGRLRTLGVFLGTSVAACAASLRWSEAGLVVGASGGIMGLAGWWLAAGREAGTKGEEARDAHGGGPADALSTRSLLVALGLTFALGLAVPLVAQIGHLGGLTAGGLLGLAHRVRGASRWTGIAAWCTALVILVALALRPVEPRASAVLGAALLGRGEPAAAAPHFRTALEARPADAELANGLAYALAEAGVALDEAEVRVREALAADPERQDFLDTLGWVLCRQGRAEEGQAVLEALARAGADFPELELHRQGCREAGVPRGTSALPEG